MVRDASKLARSNEIIVEPKSKASQSGRIREEIRAVSSIARKNDENKSYIVHDRASCGIVTVGMKLPPLLIDSFAFFAKSSARVDRSCANGHSPRLDIRTLSVGRQMIPSPIVAL